MRILFLTTTCLLWLLAGIGTAQDYPWCSRMDDVFAEVEGGNLILHHKNVTYNCCPDSFTFTVTISNDILYVTEKEILTNPCTCLCCYNLSSTVEGLSPGEWQVVYRWYDDDPWGWRDWHLTVTVGDLGAPGPVQIGRSKASGCVDPSGTPTDPDLPVTGIGLLQNAPNPFNPQTTIAFEIPEKAAVSLRVFDVSGRLVRVLIDNEIVERGRHETVWNGRDDTGRNVATGVYFYRLESGPWSEMKRMALIK
ncbi:MAG: T9SS type A sorting domain-containing protein [Candidatus Krumholzibacteria bacterium]|nr:T9SS type A sorting domain-containing protein [Candidatus Krumholzibacteria bacterium]